MKTFKGLVYGNTVAIYKKGKFTWTCKICNGVYYSATFQFHNDKQIALTYFSEDKNEINELIKKEIQDGFKKIR